VALAQQSSPVGQAVQGQVVQAALAFSTGS
jgi:hypothetical protein